MKLVSNRAFVLASTLGHAIDFPKDVPVDVPNALVPEAMEKGCVPVAGESMPQPDADAPKAPTDKAVRDEAIGDAIRMIVKRGNTSEFSSGGAPTMEAIEEACGFAIDPKERSRVWGTLSPELVYGK